MMEIAFDKGIYLTRCCSGLLPRQMFSGIGQLHARDSTFNQINSLLGSDEMHAI